MLRASRAGGCRLLDGGPAHTCRQGSRAFEPGLRRPVSTGWLAGLAAEAAEGLLPFLAELRAQLIAADVLHADETGSRVSGARHWFHVACTGLLTLLDCHPKRGKEAFADMAVLPFFSGVLITDGWKPYWSVDGIGHALCCAHLLRDLASLTGSVAHRVWADEMAVLLVEVKDAVEQALFEGSSGLNAGQLKAYRSRYTKLVNRGFSAVPTRHRPGSVHRDASNLLCRFRDQRHEVQRYWSDPAVSFDNNQGERDLRMAKLHDKISGCFRTLAGAKAFCAVRSILVLLHHLRRWCSSKPPLGYWGGSMTCSWVHGRSAITWYSCT